MAARRAAERLGSAPAPLPAAPVDSCHFYTARGDAAELFAGRKQWLLEHCYRHLRRRHGVLLDALGNPEGGQWNFDADNRQPWPGNRPSRR